MERIQSPNILRSVKSPMPQLFCVLRANTGTAVPEKRGLPRWKDAWEYVAGQLQDTVVPVLPDGAAVSGIALDELEFQPPAQFLRGEVDCPAGAVHRGHLHCPGGIPSSQYGGVSADGQDAVLLYCRSRHPDDDLAGVEVGLGGLAVRVGEEYLGEGGGEEGCLSRIALPLVVEEELPGRAVQAQDSLSACLIEGGTVL